MKTRLLSTLALLSLMVFALASPAAAQKPIPPISKTAPFKSLKNYVEVLRTKATVPATVQQKDAFRATLSTRRLAANSKAKALYAQRVNRISKQDDNKQRRQIKSIRQAQKIKIGSLNDELAQRLASLRGRENTAIDRINNSYGPKITSLGNKRAILQGRLDKAKTPAQRKNLTDKITAVQKQINVLADAKQAELNVVDTKYNGKQSNLNDLFASKVQRAKDSAARQVKQAKNAYKRLYREKLAAAKEKQGNEIELITSVRERGAGYIEQMPVV